MMTNDDRLQLRFPGVNEHTYSLSSEKKQVLSLSANLAQNMAIYRFLKETKGDNLYAPARWKGCDFSMQFTW
jgi:hypothetical protein